jgi:hypothetical protein
LGLSKGSAKRKGSSCEYLNKSEINDDAPQPIRKTRTSQTPKQMEIKMGKKLMKLSLKEQYEM